MPRSAIGARIARSEVAPAVIFVLAWLAYFGMLQYSVVRFRVRIVVPLTAGCVALSWWLARRATVRLPAGAVAVALTGSALLGLTVPLFSYLPSGWESAAMWVLAAGAVGAAVALLRDRPRSAWASAVGAYALASVIAIRTDPTPKIDVWVTLQQAADALARGDNFYSVTWVNSPGIKDAFTYLPWTAVLLAPGRWLAGDVRWMHLLWALVLAVGIWQLGVASRARVGRSIAAAATALVLLVPGTLTQIDQAWTEPLLLAALTWWAVLIVRGQACWAVIPLALACASKQHLAVVLPLLVVWRPFGAARAIATGALTGVLIAPWFLSAPADFVHDTITLLVGFHPIRFANTWYLFFLHTYGITLPFWITGLIVLGTLSLALWFVARRQPPLGELLRWVALVLLIANLVNKQAFYNQYWLVGALVAVSLVADRPRAHPQGRSADSPTPPGPVPRGSGSRPERSVG